MRAVLESSRKRGNLPALDLGAELRNEIAKRAIGEAQALGYLGDGLLVDHDGAQGFIASLTRVVGLEKELLDIEIIHDQSPGNVILSLG